MSQEPKNTNKNQMPRIEPISDFAKFACRRIKAVQKDGIRIILTVNGKPAAVVVPYKDLEMYI